MRKRKQPENRKSDITRSQKSQKHIDIIDKVIKKDFPPIPYVEEYNEIFSTTLDTFMNENSIYLKQEQSNTLRYLKDYFKNEEWFLK